MIKGDSGSSAMVSVRSVCDMRSAATVVLRVSRK